MDADSIVIQVEHVTCAYGERVVLQDVDFQVRRGEILFIVGGSGCGKSTLLKHMIGLRDPAAGRIRILGGDLARAEGEERRALLRRFGVMYQSGALFGSMAVLQNVQLPLEEFTR
ncbi:MAG: ATP-binding cassette domain-containing protein, partial [Desulfovibrionaceae bacterium]